MATRVEAEQLVLKVPTTPYFAGRWAAGNGRNAAKESDIPQIDAELDDLAGRINAFSSLALYQMERIRVKYRPVGFWCSVPLVRNIPSANCFPIRTASNETR